MSKDVDRVGGFSHTISKRALTESMALRVLGQQVRRSFEGINQV